MPPKSTHVERINALVELDRIGVEWTSVGEDEVLVTCPVHEDNSPSVGLNTDKNLWRCRAASCGARGDIVSLLAHFLGTERTVVLADLQTRYDIAEIKAISPKQIEKWHNDIWAEAGPLLKDLHVRGVTDDLIRKARLGFSKGRITIPVYDVHRNIINVRRYLPGAPGPEKMRNLPGFGKEALYQIEQLDKYDTIWILGGELKALVAASLLNQHDIGAVSATAGEGAWNVQWNKLLRGKRVFICMDVDSAGHEATRQVGNLIHRDAAEVGVINLPLDREEHPKGDINDYVGIEGACDTDLLECQSNAATFEPSICENAPVQTEVIETNLADSINPSHVGRLVRFKATPIGADEEPYFVPKKVRVRCTRNQSKCSVCPIYMMEQNEGSGAVDVTIRDTSKQLLGFLGLSDGHVPAALRALFGIPKCPVVSFTTMERNQVIEILLQPELDHGDNAKEVNRTAFVLGTEPELNAVYFFTAVIWEHPRSQKAAILVVDLEEADDNLTTFTSTPQDFESLLSFQPEEWVEDGLRAKLTEIYDDLAANVTRIVHRLSLHMLVDLTYHAPIGMKIGGREIPGWVNSLIIGDTAQGKSETVDRMMEFYRLGGRAECKNATVAGLLGGVQQVGTRWFVSWGVIPRYDRRLAVLEEVKGTSVEVLGKLTDMRSRGVATVDKIVQRRMSARTRLLFISNPRSNRPMAEYTYGVEAIPELVGSPEDVRRFDVVLCVDRREIEGRDLSAPSVDHVLDPDLCRRLILWAWTRTPEQVEFEDESHLIEEADKLKASFSGALPLIDSATTVMKVARLSAALAARTFSCSKDFERLIVRRCHVSAVSSWLSKIYGSAASGYGEFTTRFRAASEMRNSDEVVHTITNTKYPQDFIAGLLSTDQITEDDIATWTALDANDVRIVLSVLVRKNAIRRAPRQRRVYTKTEGFIRLLKSMEGKTSTPSKSNVSRF